MKNRIIRVIIAAMSMVLLTSCNSIKVHQYSSRSYNTDSMLCLISNKVCNTLNSMTAIHEVTASDSTLNKWNNTEVYFVRSRTDYDMVTEVLENRNGKIIIEVIEGTVLDDCGNGSDECGFYVKYDETRFLKGDKVQSVFVYNPDTNYADDILYRVDTLID